MRYTPPWLSPWWLPRTTDVVTSFTIDTGADPAARSSAKPRQRHHFLLKDSPIVRGRCSDRSVVPAGLALPGECRFVRPGGVAGAAQPVDALLVEQVADDERRLPAVVMREPELQRRGSSRTGRAVASASAAPRASRRPRNPRSRPGLSRPRTGSCRRCGSRSRLASRRSSGRCIRPRASTSPSGETGMTVPAEISGPRPGRRDPSGVNVSSENSGSARKALASMLKFSVGLQLTLISTPFCSALPPLNVPRIHHGLPASEPDRLSWMSSHCMKNAVTFSCRVSSSHWLFKPAS